MILLDRGSASSASYRRGPLRRSAAHILPCRNRTCLQVPIVGPASSATGAGLSLRVHRTKSGRISKPWRQRLRIEGQLTSVGLGPYPEITLAEAGRKALDDSRAVR